jgi:hypothetical protein
VLKNLIFNFLFISFFVVSVGASTDDLTPRISTALLSLLTDQQTPIRERAALTKILRITRNCDSSLSIDDYRLPVSFGKTVDKKRFPGAKINYLGKGAMGFVHRIADQKTGRAKVEKSYFRIDNGNDEVYEGLTVAQVVQQEALTLKWFKDFLIRNNIHSIKIPQVRDTFEVGRFNLPGMELENVWGTPLHKLMEDDTIPAYIRSTIFVRFIEAMKEVYIAIKREIKEGKISASTDLYVDEYVNIEGFGNGLPYLVLNIENIESSLLPNKELAIAIVRSNTIVSNKGEIYLIDPY